MAEGKFGFNYWPGSEAEVVMLFGALMPYVGSFLRDLGFGENFFIEEWREQPTDCIIEVDGKKLNVEFELYSSRFKNNHDPEKCDLIICWEHDWNSCPANIKVLALKEIYEKIAEKGLRLIIKNNGYKYTPRDKRWPLEEFMSELKENVKDNEFKIFQEFIESIRDLDGIQLETGRGDRIPTLGLGFKKFGTFPIGIEATGKAYVCYYNVNAKPPKPLLPINLIEKIWKLLGAPKTKNGEMKKWHYIKASNSAELIKKLKEIINVVLEAEK